MFIVIDSEFIIVIDSINANFIINAISIIMILDSDLNGNMYGHIYLFTHIFN